MSDIMLLGVLRMPLPDNPADMGVLEWFQVRDRMSQAAAEIEDQRARIKLAADYILDRLGGKVDNDHDELVRLWRKVAGPDAVPIREEQNGAS